MLQTAPPPPPLMSPETHRRALSFKAMSPSLLIILGILVLTFFASISLCLLLRHLNSRCLRRLATSSSASATESRRISTRRVNPEAPPSLPLFTYSSINRRSSTTIPADCAVCLSKFEPDDELRLLPLCCHGFHAMCIDAWLQSHQTCPLCRAPIFASDAEVMTLVSNAGAAATNGGSFRLEIGNVSQRSQTASHQHSNSADGNLRSYSIGSFEYVVDDESSEVRLSNAHKDEIVLVIAEPEPLQPPQSSLAAEVGSGRSSWLKDYIDRMSSSLSSRDISFRSSGRFFTGSSRRSEVSLAGDWGVEANRLGDEISEMFRWLSGM